MSLASRSVALCLLTFSLLQVMVRTEIRIRDIINEGVSERDVVLDPMDFQHAATSTDADLSHLGISPMTDPRTPGKLEGDIGGINDVQDYIENSNRRGRNAIKSRWRRWPNGEIPYVLSSRYGRYSKRTIARAMEEYEKRTCVRFIPRESAKHRDYIYIHPDDGCYSLVGRTGGRQPLSLDAGCIQTGTVIHELMHTVGFFHEQSRNDRDDWIELDWDNVMTGARDQFDKYSLRTITHLDEEYDYNSIMHYGPYAFTRNGRKTILPRKPGGANMGQRDGFSRIDLAKINKLYYCDTEEKVTETEPEEEEEEETVTFPPIGPKPSGKCEDNNWRCFFWSLGVVDYCDKYEKVKYEICPKSCGTCKEGETVPERPTTTTSASTTTRTTTTRRPSTRETDGCKDENSHCPRWSEKGLCTKAGYTNFMAKYCRKSCGNCGERTETEVADESTEDGEGCRDNPGYKMQCHFIKQLGGCSSRRNRRITEEHCQKSCRLC